MSSIIFASIAVCATYLFTPSNVTEAAEATDGAKRSDAFFTYTFEGDTSLTEVKKHVRESYLNTNPTNTPWGKYDDPNWNAYNFYESERKLLENYRNAYIIKREVKCDKCGHVTTNEIDVTDLINSQKHDDDAAIWFKQAELIKLKCEVERLKVEKARLETIRDIQNIIKKKNENEEGTR